MMFLSLAARSLSRPAIAGTRVWTTPAGTIIASRFLSSKKTDGETVDEAVPPSKKALAAAIKHNGGSPKLEGGVTPGKKSAHAKKTKDARGVSKGKFLPIDKLPKPPREITDMPLEEFYAKVYMRDLPERPEITPSNVFAYKFEIPSQFIRSKNLERGSKSLSSPSSFEPAHNILDFRSDYDTNNMFRVPEHPLRESITGMFISNPLMEGIDNDFLWDLYPKGKTFDHVPFGGDASFNGFKNWEKAENKKVKEKEAQFETKLNEMKEFNATLNESKSFYRKAPRVTEKKTAASTESPKKVGGRRKLDRSLLKQYRKYKNEGWLRRKHNRDDEDDKF